MRILGIFFTVLGIAIGILGLINISGEPSVMRGDNVVFVDNYAWILALFSLMAGGALLFATRGKA